MKKTMKQKSLLRQVHLYKWLLHDQKRTILNIQQQSHKEISDDLFLLIKHRSRQLVLHEKRICMIDMNYRNEKKSTIRL